MDTIKIPFYAKIAFIFIAMYAFVYTLYIGQHIIVPIIYATIIAILLNPFVNFLINKKVNKVVAIITAVIFIFIIIACLVYFVSTQVSMFTDTYPQFLKLINQLNLKLLLQQLLTKDLLNNFE